MIRGSERYENTRESLAAKCLSDASPPPLPRPLPRLHPLLSFCPCLLHRQPPRRRPVGPETSGLVWSEPSRTRASRFALVSLSSSHLCPSFHLLPSNCSFQLHSHATPPTSPPSHPLNSLAVLFVLFHSERPDGSPQLLVPLAHSVTWELDAAPFYRQSEKLRLCSRATVRAFLQASTPFQMIYGFFSPPPVLLWFPPLVSSHFFSLSPLSVGAIRSFQAVASGFLRFPPRRLGCGFCRMGVGARVGVGVGVGV